MANEPKFNPNPKDKDALWQEFDGIEVQKTEEEESAYKEIEKYNRHIINQIVGLEKAEFNLVKPIPKEGEILPVDDRPSEELKMQPFLSILYLRPDSRDELRSQGESPDVIESQGNPYTIRGKVPERTKQLLLDLLTGLEATRDDDRSDSNMEIWNGNVGVSPIELQFINNQYISYVSGKEEIINSLTAYARRPSAD